MKYLPKFNDIPRWPARRLVALGAFLVFCTFASYQNYVNSVQRTYYNVFDFRRTVSVRHVDRCRQLAGFDVHQPDSKRPSDGQLATIGAKLNFSNDVVLDDFGIGAGPVDGVLGEILQLISR